MRNQIFRWRWGSVPLVFVVALAAAAVWQTSCASDPEPSAAASRYHCPMHPTVVSDRPGECPICGMRLVTVDEPQKLETPASRYHCPMHPTVVSDRPGECPICGMRLVPIERDPTRSAAGGEGREDADAESRAVVTLSPARRGLLGVRSEPVREQLIETRLRTTGRVVADERRTAHVHAKFDGYVERLHVNYTGRLVRKGEPLLSIYSPELVATQQEYLLAMRARRQFAESEIPSLAQGSADLLEAARQRLLLFDIRPDDIEALERSGTVRRTFDLHAEVGGFATQKNVVQGMRVMPADTLFEIVDLTHVWVVADVFDSDLSAIRLGQPATVTVSSVPGRTWRGVVSNIAPVVDQATRTIKVRVEVDNPDLALRPDMFGDVVLVATLGRGLVVPDDAVIDLGDRKIVFVDRPDGSLEPRGVHTGVKIPEGYQVLDGLAAGEQVVTAANFLLDSESSLRAALSRLAAPATPGAGPR